MTDLSSEYSERLCAWCRQPIRAAARRDAITCSTPCRQARHRFVQGVGTPPPAAGGPPLRLAYADPPYPGLSRKYYAGHPDYAGEVDHAALISRLASTYDGWALSTSAAALPDVLKLCPPGVRVAAWHRGPIPTKARGPLSAWEPVIFCGGRLYVDPAGATRRPAIANSGAVVGRDASRHAGGDDPSNPAGRRVEATRWTRSGDPLDTSGGPTRRVDSLVLPRGGHRTTDPARVVGTKPPEFARWIFDLLGAAPGDEFTDLFPGSGGITRAWTIYNGQAH